MESANLHHHHQHQLQDQRASSTSSLGSAAPSCYGFGNNNHFWTSSSTTTTNNTAFIGHSNPNYNGRQKSNILVSPLNNSMVPDMGFHWTDNAGAQSFSSQSAHDLQQTKIKEEQPFPKFTELLNGPSNMDEYYFLPQMIKNEHKDLSELSEKLLLKTLTSSCQINGHQISTGDFLSNNNNMNGAVGVHYGRGQFSQIYPSINISNLNQSSSSSSSSPTTSTALSSSCSSLNMSLRALDHLASSTLSGSSLDHHNLGGINSSFGLDQMPQPHHRLSCSAHRKVSSFNNEVIEAKRPAGSSMETKGTQASQKKSRLESRTPCPPFKVRKEKLGDRIAALQQLVAPFGKTDTASVLMEAIGYIKFLQNQVETLSVPYMKSAARNKSYKTMQGGPKGNGNEEAKRDLRSQGLCLVPLSCMSYMTGEGGGGSVWPPSNFGGET
nr:transcription factor bHLH110 isoform X2 [Ziziphus jujuba var. spinosa]